MMDVSQFLSTVENDDTLQNIRKEYLNSKRTLQELMTNQSPTKRAEFTKKATMAREGNGNVGTNSYAKQGAGISGPSDEFLRRQLRETLARKADEKPAIPLSQGNGVSWEQGSAVASRLEDLERRLYQHELQIQTLKNELYQSNALNRSLQNKVGVLEDHVRMIAAQEQRMRDSGPAGPNSADKIRAHTNNGYLDRPQSAPSTSSTSEWVRNALHESDDTRVLLGWKQPGSNKSAGYDSHRRKYDAAGNQQRVLSNFDDNTSKLINIAG